MRLLNTFTGQFVWLPDPSTVRYAILSHTWRSKEEGEEQSYGDVRALQHIKPAEPPARHFLDRLRKTPTRPIPPPKPFLCHPALSDKIKGFCKVAREAGYELAWIDSCCIDKSSSAELSEAINSMYNWYHIADVCYVYLADVPDGDKPGERESAFRASRWWRRGWTLQELIAPRRVVFLTKAWRFLGTRMGYTSTVENITGINFAILTGTAKLESVSIARRISWAATRETTRIEDEAYCLMGLFGVHMPTIYGEGRNAFLRLQEEIIKNIPDQSIFAWGRSCTTTIRTGCVPRNRPFAPPPVDPSYRQDSEASLYSGTGLLARSPRDFESSGDVAPISLEAFRSHLGMPPDDSRFPSLHSLFTPHGVRLRLLLVDISTEPGATFDDPPKPHAGSAPTPMTPTDDHPTEPHTLALLRCLDENGSLVALPLCRQPELVPRAAEARVQEPLVVATHIPFTQGGPLDTTNPRTIRLQELALANAQSSTSKSPWTPHEVYIHRYYGPLDIHHAGDSPFSRVKPQHPLDFGSAVTACIPPGCVQELHALGFAVAPLRTTYSQSNTVQVFSVTTTLRSTGNQSSGTQHPDGTQVIAVGITLTNGSLRSSLVPFIERRGTTRAAEFTVQHFLRTPFLGEDSSRTQATGRCVSRDNLCDYISREVPCADEMNGHRTYAIHQTERGVLHAQAEFLLYADLDASVDAGWESSCAVDTRLLRVAVRGTPVERDPGGPGGSTFQFRVSMELSERHRPKKSSGRPGPAGHTAPP